MRWAIWAGDSAAPVAMSCSCRATPRRCSGRSLSVSCPCTTAILRIPAYVVDYSSEEISLTTWPGAIVATVTKKEVVDHGVRGDLFPPKTTRHILKEKVPESPVPLKDLM